MPHITCEQASVLRIKCITWGLGLGIGVGPR